MRSIHKEVVIIGAGYSGLAAGKVLAASGVKVKVLEASSTVGGRARTVQLSPGLGKAELGATWLHGLEGHPVYELAVQLGLMPKYVPSKKRRSVWGKSLYVREGENTPLKDPQLFQAVKASHAYASALESVVEKHGESGEQGTGLESVGEHLRRAYEKGAEKGLHSAVAAEAWAWRERLQRAIDGCSSTDEYSVAGLASYSELPGPNLPLPCGYQAVAQIYAEGLDILYGHRVQEIQWGGARPMVVCTNDAVFEADAVILTVSLGVLKAEHTTLFSPPLPEQNAEAVQSLAIGTVEKLFLAFLSAAQPSSLSSLEALQTKRAASLSKPDSPPQGQGKRLSGQEGAISAGQPAEAAESGDEHSLTAEGVTPMEGDATDGERAVLSYQLLFKTDPQSLMPGSAEQNRSRGQGARLTGGRAERKTADVSTAEGGIAEGDKPELPSWARGIYSIRLWGPEFLPLSSSSCSKGTSKEPLQQGNGLLNTEVKHQSEKAQQEGPEAELSDSHAESKALQERESSVPVEGGGASLVSSVPCQAAEARSLELEEETRREAGGRGAVVWIAGEEAEALGAASDEEVVMGLQAILRAFPAMQLPQDFQLVRSTWGTDPLFRGSYSYIPTGCTTSLIEALRSPLYASPSGTEEGSEGEGRGSKGKPVVFFAGEATHSEFFGTVHGAVSSGERAAQEFLSSL